MDEQQSSKKDLNYYVYAIASSVITISLLVLAVAYFAESEPAFKSAFTTLIFGIGAVGLWNARDNTLMRTVGLALAAAALFKYGIPSAEAADAASAAAKLPMGEWIHSSKNAANSILCSTIGDPLSVFGCGGKETALWPILKTFNLAVFAFAAIWMSWNIISSAMSSAAEGQFLGRRRSGTWVPLRTTIGFAMLIPVFHGLNLAQLVMIWATAVGSGIAGSVAVVVAEKVNWGAIYTPPAVIKAAAIEPDLVEGLRCLKNWVNDTKILTADGVTDPEAIGMKWGSVIASEAGELRIKMGAQPAAGGYTETECGEVIITLPSTNSKDSQVRQITKGIETAITSSVAGLVAGYQKTISTVSDETDQAREFPAIQRDFDFALNAQVLAIVTAANAFSGSSDVIKTAIKEQGWVGLGFQGVHATRAAFEVTNAVQTEVRKEKTGREPLSAEFKFGNLKAWFTSLIDRSMNSLVDSIGNSVAGALTGFAGANPMAALQGLGVSIIAWVAGFALLILALPLIAAGSATVLTGIGSALSAIPFFGGAAATATTAAATMLGAAINSTTAVLTGILVMLGVPLLFFGLKLAAYIPFLVAIMWSGAILAWLMIVLESLVGAPLWALVHLDMDGEGMGQKTTHGYMFLLNLLFRPIILVFSLVGAMLAMSVIFSLLGGAIAGMITDMSQRSHAWFANLLMILGAVYVMVFAAETIIMQSLSFLWNIPNNVFTWLGGHFGSNVGQGMEGAGNQAGSAISGLGGTASGALQRAGESKKMDARMAAKTQPPKKD